MVPAPINVSAARNSRLLYTVTSFVVHGVPKLFASNDPTSSPHVHTFAKRELKEWQKITYGILIPILVLLSGLFAGLTLGYMSLDETQLHVLSISGTEKQKAYAKKIQPIRKNGHLLLVTLLLANMIVNESLPVIADPVLGGGVQSVVVSTVLIVIFSEIIPQSICTRYGLAVGASMVWLVRILMWTLGIVAWPVAKLLEFTLGSHHGIMYRRTELKELIALHSAGGDLGGDLKADTVNIIGATLDLQEKIVNQIMTPIEDVFMLRIDSKLDLETMKRIGETGHSRVPIYEEVEVPLIKESDSPVNDFTAKPEKVKKIVGILFVKQCLMLDPKDATPIKALRLGQPLFLPQNESLLTTLNKFQEGRSHVAVVSRMAIEKAASVKAEVKKSLTRKLKDRIGIDDSDSSSSESDSEKSETGEDDKDATLRGDGKSKRSWRRKKKSKKSAENEADTSEAKADLGNAEKGQSRGNEQLKSDSKGGLAVTWAKVASNGREQSMPDDAVLAKDGAKQFLQSFDASVMPLGIVTLEDILEELIGEEIYDEFDSEGHSRLRHYPAKRKGSRHDGTPAPVFESPQIAITAVTHSPNPMKPSEGIDHQPHIDRSTSTLGAALTSIKKRQAKMKAKPTTGEVPAQEPPRTNSAPAEMRFMTETSEGTERIPEEKKNDAPDL